MFLTTLQIEHLDHILKNVKLHLYGFTDIHFKDNKLGTWHFGTVPIPNKTLEVVRGSRSIEVTERVKFPPERISSLKIPARNTATILALGTVHAVWTYYCILKVKQLGPLLKLVICLCVPPVMLFCC